MNSSDSYLQRGQDLPREIHVTNQPCGGVYRYSYNLGILELPTRRNQNATSYSTTRTAESQGRFVHKCNASVEKLRICRHNHEGQNTSVPTETNSLQETEIEKQYNHRKTQEPISANETSYYHNRCQKIYVHVCPGENNKGILQESVEISTTMNDKFSITEELDQSQKCFGTEEHRDEKSGNESCDFHPPIEKFHRAARVLGVCWPSKELFSICRERRNGICEANDSCSQHSTLLRILNKRF